MELRIDINNCKKQFAGVGRDYLCNFQDSVLYKFPYPASYRQFEIVAYGIMEERSDSFVYRLFLFKK